HQRGRVPRARRERLRGCGHHLRAESAPAGNRRLVARRRGRLPRPRRLELVSRLRCGPLLRGVFPAGDTEEVWEVDQLFIVFYKSGEVLMAKVIIPTYDALMNPL